MNNQQPDVPLTEAAQQALGSLTDEYRQRILNEAISRSLRIDGIQPEISVRDIIESAEKVAALRSLGKERQKDFVMQIYQVMGVMLVTSGIVLMLKGEFSFKLDFTQQVAVVLTMLGIMLILSPFFLRRLLKAFKVARSTSNISLINATGVFLSKWHIIENLLRGHLERNGHSAAREPFSSLVSALQDKGLLGAEDISLLKQLLNLRNHVVHESSYATRQTLERAIELSNKLIAKLQAIEK